VSKRIISNRARQSGAILIISLLLLLVLTVLGVVMMQTTQMQERMAGNTRDLNMALQGAESGLRYAEAVVAAFPALPDTTGTLPCTVCQKGTLPVAIYDPTQFNWTANATSYGQGGVAATLVPNLLVNPMYTTEDLGFVPDSLDTGQDAPEGRDFFQLSSRSTGATGLAGTVLQSTYARRF
jgi:type IV pilus assembly protein PilX